MKSSTVARGVAVGDVFGELEVIEHMEPKAEPSGKMRPWVLVQCSCGTKFEVRAQGLRRGTPRMCRSCAYKVRRATQVGDVFDALTVESFDKPNGRRLVAVCRCECGNEVRIRPYLLKNNQTNSCGCRPNGSWKGHGELSGTMFYRTKRGAEVRGIEHQVSIEYLWGLFLEQERKCALTGLPLAFSRRNDSDTTASLDRIDSAMGYVEGNVHWVHKDVNLIKMDFSLDRFRELCHLVTAHNRRAASVSSTQS